jgi:hypothetical protein
MAARIGHAKTGCKANSEKAGKRTSQGGMGTVRTTTGDIKEITEKRAEEQWGDRMVAGIMKESV